MTRQTAYQILTKYVTNDKLLKHALAVEAVMQVLATRFAGNPEEWGIAGLLHDADYEKAKGHPDQHGVLLFKLEQNSIPSNVEHAIQAHNSEFTTVHPNAPLDWALLCCDELTLLIMSAALAHPDKKLASLTTDFLLQRLKDPHFEKKAHKENIYLCSSKLNIPIPEFVEITLKAMQQIHEALAL